MFFRENVPNEAKLRAKMEFASGERTLSLPIRPASPGLTCACVPMMPVSTEFTAYACQCKWLSVDAAARVDSCRVKWSCAGH